MDKLLRSEGVEAGGQVAALLEKKWRLGAWWGVGNLEQRVPIESCFCSGEYRFIRTVAVEMELGEGAGNKPVESW